MSVCLCVCEEGMVAITKVSGWSFRRHLIVIHRCVYVLSDIFIFQKKLSPALQGCWRWRWTQGHDADHTHKHTHKHIHTRYTHQLYRENKNILVTSVSFLLTAAGLTANHTYFYISNYITASLKEMPKASPIDQYGCTGASSDTN